jgi:hypothetical protein
VRARACLGSRSPAVPAETRPPINHRRSARSNRPAGGRRSADHHRRGGRPRHAKGPNLGSESGGESAGAGRVGSVRMASRYVGGPGPARQRLPSWRVPGPGSHPELSAPAPRPRRHSAELLEARGARCSDRVLRSRMGSATSHRIAASGG